MRGDIVNWSVVARNLPEHARNRIHTDEGAQAAGFPRALVAGVTTYAYLTHPVVAAWGLDWVAQGGGEVRFRSPVFAADLVSCTPASEVRSDGVRVDALVAGAESARASLQAWRPANAPGRPPDRPGEDLPVYEIPLRGEYDADYGRAAGDDLDVYEHAGVVHPAVWPALANHVVHRELARGSWIHTRSRIQHHALAAAGGVAVVSSRVVDRFVRSGLRAVLDVVITVDGAVVATLEHEAIVDLAAKP